jgi:hypothetical protein
MRRFGMALVLAVALVALAAPTGFAAKPVKVPVDFAGTAPVSGICSFPITVDFHVTGTSTFYLDGNGVVIREEDHWFEQDTFSANGKTGVGDGERFNQSWTFDSAGNVLSNFVSGQVENVTLPDGTRFFSAGRVNFLNHPNFVVTPDTGHSGNVDALCAAFA